MAFAKVDNKVSPEQGSRDQRSMHDRYRRQHDGTFPYAQDLLEAAHSTSGLSWGSTIVLTSLALRVAVTLPLAVYQHHVLARFANLDREMAGIAQELKRETMQATRMFNLTEKQARHLYRRNVRCRGSFTR
ncbi:hypothetical protein HPB52_020894 [Rhipicephalus sanguineus]|uniref:Uncharacterized protein n=1 Tax=Rhipicephalus sanguineus TaxID=34632 RepID=A0A9D4YQR8_RHISA|nr:hypothetical protein HPB52_020894 [Rhipicephalus sanguineus]